MAHYVKLAIAVVIAIVVAKIVNEKFNKTEATA